MIYGIILSAGYGKRMESELPKGMVQILDKPFICHILDTFKELKLDRTVAVLGYKMEEFMDVVRKYSIDYVVQKELNGTAKAVEATSCILEGLEGISIIVPVDLPFVSVKLYNELINFHKNNNNDLTILSAELDNPFGYGRIFKNNNKFVGIIEEKDASDDVKLIKEVNVGAYIINNNLLFKYLKLIDNKNAKNEYYFTDIAKHMISDNLRVETYKTKRINETISINDIETLNKATETLKGNL